MVENDEAVLIFMANFDLIVTVLPPVLEGAVIVTLWALDAVAPGLLLVILITSLFTLDDKMPLVVTVVGCDEV